MSGLHNYQNKQSERNIGFAHAAELYRYSGGKTFKKKHVLFHLRHLLGPLRQNLQDFGPTGVHATANLDPDLAPPRPGDFLYWKLGVFLWAYDGAFWRSTANPWKNELQRDEEPRHAGAVRNDVFDKAGGRKLQKWLRALQRTPLCLKSF